MQQGRWLSADMRRFMRDHALGIIVSLLLAIFAVPLGNLGTFLLTSARTFLSLPLTVAISVLLTLVVVLFFLWLYERSQRIEAAARAANALQALASASQLVSSDDTLLRLLPGLVAAPAEQRDQALRQLLHGYLQDVRRVFAENVSRAAILLPNTDQPGATGEYLTVHAWYELSPESIERTRFYIGPATDRLRGVAGKAFVRGEIHIVHLRQDAATGRWRPDDPDYQVFDPARTDAPYQSFAAVPITGGAEGRLGVVCFDSPSVSAFDFAGVEELLTAIAARIAAIIRIYEQLSAPPTPPPPSRGSRRGA